MSPATLLLISVPRGGLDFVHSVRSLYDMIILVVVVQQIHDCETRKCREHVVGRRATSGLSHGSPRVARTDSQHCLALAIGRPPANTSPTIQSTIIFSVDLLTTSRFNTPDSQIQRGYGPS